MSRLSLMLMLGLGGTASVILYYTCREKPHINIDILQKLRHIYHCVANRRNRRRIQAPLAHFQSKEYAACLKWVSIAGTVFDVSSDNSILFDLIEGSYAHWLSHDITKLLIVSSVDFTEYQSDKRSTHYDSDIPFSIVDPNLGTLQYRRYLTVQEWYERFHQRYSVIGQLSDRFTENPWESAREIWQRHNLRPKCPLGFGSKSKKKKQNVKRSEIAKYRYVHFYGRCYDVSARKEFAESGSLAHFVGHDITYAIAMGSTFIKDLDVVDIKLGLDQQIALEQYRISLEKDCTELIIEESNIHSVSIFDIIASGDVKALEHALSSSPASLVNERCIHSKLTPLHRAIESNQSEMVALLLQYGADRDATAELYDHASPSELARRFAGEEIQNYFQ